MILATLAVVGVLGCFQEEPIYCERIESLVVQLDAEAPDPKALEEIGQLPSTLIPLVKHTASPDRHPRAAKKLEAVLPPDPWGRIHRGSIRSARDFHEFVVSGRILERLNQTPELYTGLACLPPAEADAILAGFAAAKEPVLREIAAAARAMLRPDPAAKHVRQLGSPATCDRAADLILLAGETTAIREAVDLFCRQERPECVAAGRVLETFGPGEFAPRILALLDRKEGLVGGDMVLRILERSGGPAFEKKVLELFQRVRPGEVHGYALIRILMALGAEGADLAAREFYAGLDKEKLKSLSQVPLLGPESTVRFLEAVRAENSRFGPVHLNALHAHAYSELKAPLQAWATEADAKPSDLKFILPLLGATGGKDVSDLLLQKLEDPRCSGAAALGLAMIGDPAHAPAVWRAFLRDGGTRFLNNSMVSFPAEAMEAELIAALSTSPIVNRRAFQIIRNGPSPAIRKALFALLLDGNRRSMVGWEVPILLGEGRNDEEKAWIEKIRREGSVNHQPYGHYLAMKSGDAQAAAALAASLTLRPGMGRDSRWVYWWRSFESAGDVWMKAVEAEWTRRGKEWFEGTLALARAGNKEAIERLQAEMEAPNYPMRDLGIAALAIHGDERCRTWLLQRMVSMYSPDGGWDPSLNPLFRDPAFRKRLIIMARCQASRGGAGGALAILAEQADPEAKPLYLLGALRGSVTCLRALFLLKSPDAFPVAVRLLRTGDPYARLGAVRALQEWGGRAAVRHLASRLDDMEEAYDSSIERGESGPFQDPPNPRIAVAAMAALEKLTGVASEGNSHAERRTFWKNWYAKNRADWK